MMATEKHKHSRGIYYTHQCAAQNEGTRLITRYEAKASSFHPSCGWRIDADEDFSIAYCPYYGEKLEPPDVVEVSRKVLEDWSAAAHAVKVQVVNGKSGAAIKDARTLATRIKMASTHKD